ncbi:hypothetical protein MNBD_ALPHA12-1261 [hydrothermal vent metagenome]|uniref:Transcriptional regulator, RpiR family n=1 Tax=hydrothermal vent metagenome TaxID=652676 RepID=A0A3B0TSM5_9ZZZZ
MKPGNSHRKAQMPSTLEDLRLRLNQIGREMSGQIRRAANYAAANPDEIVFSSIRDFAEKSAVSPASIIRMSRGLGFGGYREFRAALRMAVKEFNASSGQTVINTKPSADFLTSFSSIAPGELSATAAKMDQVADKILSANTVFVVGFRSAHNFAQYFVYLAHMAMAHFRLTSPAMSSAADHLASADANDIVIVFSVAPYAVEAVQLAYFLSENKIPTLAITDNANSPFSKKCDYVLEANRSHIGPIQSMAGCVTLSEALLARCFERMGKDARQKIGEFENRVRRMRGYWPPE